MMQLNFGRKNNGLKSIEFKEVPDNYRKKAEKQGRLEKLTYNTYESFSYLEKSQQLTKAAWIYLPYDYDNNRKYNILYLSHGGWSNETTLMGTADNPTEFENIIDNAIEKGDIEPLIIVFPTYNNLTDKDSWDYNLAIRLCENFHNELVNDLIPTVEDKYSTYAKDTSKRSLIESRNHRGFGGFSMGSVNTWCTFHYSLDYFRYFIPMSGSYSLDGDYMAGFVTSQGYGSDDFIIFAASGSDDFAYESFKTQIINMSNVTGVFNKDNLILLIKNGYVHDYGAAYEYVYNALVFFNEK